jgi:hypothetical protein
MMITNSDDLDLLAAFVSAFGRIDDMRSPDAAADLRVTEEGDGWHTWRPKLVSTDKSVLEALYQDLQLRGIGSARFPPLYEMLILSYRWAEVDLGAYRLLANQPADDLSPLLTAIRMDQALYSTLIPNGYVQFGRGPDVDYDPVCFDFRHRQKNGDCQIVKLHHEAILCDGRIGKITELAPNFRSLVLGTVARAVTLASDDRPSDKVASADPDEFDASIGGWDIY